MSQISNYGENALINFWLRDTALAMPTMYLSAHTGDPGETGANELAGGNYTRIAAPTWNAPSGRAITNADIVKFPLMIAAVGTITHIAVWDAMSGGNLWWYSSALSLSIVTETGISPAIAPAAINIGLGGEVSTYLSHATLNHLFRGVEYTRPGTSIYASLHTGDPGLTGASEVSGNNYARVQVSAWDAPSNGATANTNNITWPVPTPSSFGTITHKGLFDAATSGNFLIAANLDVSLVTSAGSAPQDNAGSFDVVVE